jgi:hypothetical protein
MTLRDPKEYLQQLLERFRSYDHPRARIYVEYYDENGYFPEGIWQDVQALDMQFNLHIAMGERPEDVEFDI